MLNPFASRSTNSDESILILEGLIELFTNEKLKSMFEQGYHKFWLQKQITLHPTLWVAIQKLSIVFLPYYLEERGFSAIMILIIKKRNRLEIRARGDL